MSDPTLEECRWVHAIESSAFGVWDLDLLLDRVHYSPQWKARLGFSRIDAPDSSAFWRCRVHPDDFAPMFQSIRAHLDGCSATYEMQFRLRSNGSGYRTMLSRGRVVARDAAGNATRMVGTMVDVKGWPAYVANYGLAGEGPATRAPSPRPPSHMPFHAALGTGLHSPLIEQVDDLLDIAWREADAAR